MFGQQIRQANKNRYREPNCLYRRIIFASDTNCYPIAIDKWIRGYLKMLAIQVHMITCNVTEVHYSLTSYRTWLVPDSRFWKRKREMGHFRTSVVRTTGGLFRGRPFRKLMIRMITAAASKR